MKILSEHDLKPEDSLQLDFAGDMDPQAELETELEPFLEALESYADGWMPNVINGKRRRKYSRTSFWELLKGRRKGNSTLLGLYRTEWPAIDGCLGLRHPPAQPKLDIRISVKPLSFFAEAERCHQFVEMVRAWACRYPVVHATAHSSDDLNLVLAPHFSRGFTSHFESEFDTLHELCWLNVFGSKWVHTLGRERILSSPSWRVEELPNGCILLVTRPTVSDFATDDARIAHARAHAHLRPDLDFDSLLRTLRARTSLLAPVVPHFHPGLAPLLSRIVDDVASYQRQQQIATFNSWQPPEPQEWSPATAALPSDVDHLEATLEHYDTLAEHLVALRHSLVPSVFQASPESLPDLDFSFWHENFPKRYVSEVIEQHAIPAVGAYLGLVLVRRLGGRWIPRQKLEESQVLVGSRVWFPFLRARHYLSSRQSLLDSSLTWLYRVAERHRQEG